MTNRCHDSSRRNAPRKVNAPRFIRSNGFQIARPCVRARAEEFHSRVARDPSISVPSVSMSNRNSRTHVVDARGERVDYTKAGVSRARCSFADSRVVNVGVKIDSKLYTYTLQQLAFSRGSRFLGTSAERALSSSHRPLRKGTCVRGRALFSRVALCLSFPTTTEVFAPRLLRFIDSDILIRLFNAMRI